MSVDRSQFILILCISIDSPIRFREKCQTESLEALPTYHHSKAMSDPKTPACRYHPMTLIGCIPVKVHSSFSCLITNILKNQVHTTVSDYIVACSCYEHKAVRAALLSQIKDLYN